MRVVGRVSADRPDPANEWREVASSLGVAVAGLVPQRHLEDWGISGYSGSRRGVGPDAVLADASFARSYSAWRKPEDRTDPVNLVALSSELREALVGEVPADLPGWLLRARDRLRYPVLWEAVHTHWFGPGSDADQQIALLLQRHAEYILRNQYRDELGLQSAGEASEPLELISRDDVRAGAAIVDGVQRAGVTLKAHSLVSGVGVALSDGRSITAVVRRDLLDLVEVEFLSDAG